MTEPEVTNMSSRPPSPERSQWEPLASIRNRGRVRVPWDHSQRLENVDDALNGDVDRFMVEEVCAATFVGDGRECHCETATFRNEPDGGFESRMISIPKVLARMFDPGMSEVSSAPEACLNGPHRRCEGRR